MIALLNNNDINTNTSISGAVNWWKDFCLERQHDDNLINIFRAFEVADNDGTESSLEHVRKLIEALDEKAYKDEIDNFNKRFKILGKRLERKVSSSFGSTIKHLREQSGLSLAKLGEISGVSASYINRMEIGQRNAPSYPIIEKLADSLGVEISYLLNVAGVENDTKPSTISKLIYSNNVTLKDGEKAMNGAEKNQFIEIMDFIIDAEWKDKKHIEMLELIRLIDGFKE